MAVRALGIVVVLATGHGLIDMGKAALVALAVTYSLTFLAVRRVFPQLRFSPRLVTYSMFRQMLSYGLHTFGATIGLQVLNQSAPMLIGHFMPSSAFVVYFTQPQRLLNYSVDMVGRVGFITGSHTAELAAKEDYVSIARMGIYINRYCFMLFTPVGAGANRIRPTVVPRLDRCQICRHVRAVTASDGCGDHARHRRAIQLQLDSLRVRQAPRLRLLTDGRSRFLHRRVVLGDSALRYSWRGVGGIYSSSGESRLRAFVASLPFGSLQFVEIFERHLYHSAACRDSNVVLSLWIRQNWIPGNNLREVIEGGALLAAIYYGIAYFICLETEHRSMPVNWVKARLLKRAA